jgi:serine/threonine protein kinase
VTELKLQQSLLDGRYEIRDCLGRGSYAEIYVARDLSAEAGEPETIVIKALNVLLQGMPDTDLERTLIENFQNEAVALDRVRHPNIISRLGHGTAIDLSGTPFHYLVLEYMPGGEIGTRCRQQPFSLERVLFYLEQVCSGLAHAHECGVIHRDIKPQNLLLTADAQVVKIADFGVAKLEASEGAITRVGTNVYAAPEHNPLVHTGPLDTASLSGNHVQLTPAADIYSLAKTTYTLLVGEPPRRFSHRQITEFPESLANKSWASEVLRVLRRATEDKPENRYQTVQEFWEDLADASLPPTQLLKSPDEVESQSRKPPKLTGALEAVSEAPPRPRFESQDIIKKSQLRANGGNRPRIVVPVSVAQADNIFATRPAEHARQRNPAGGIPQAMTTPDGQQFGIAPPTQSHGRWLRILVALSIILAFAGILLATHYYVSRQRAQNPTVTGNTTSPFVGREGFVLRTANLRREPSQSSNPPLRTVERGSRVRILSVSDNNTWYEVEVLTLEGSEHDSITRGWMGKSTISFD